MRGNYYDIESLSNVFTLVNFKLNNDSDKKDAIVDVYYVIDTPALRESIKTKKEDIISSILDANKNLLTRNINFYDLATDSGLDHLNKNMIDIVKDTDENYDKDKDLYFFGYNSYNYDTTVLAYFLQERQRNTPIEAKTIRKFNDLLFEPVNKKNMPSVLGNFQYKTAKYIRSNLLKTGRYIDVARLNESQSKVGLKRLLGLIGLQILESDKLSNTTTINNFEELADLIAYNVSDTVNLEELMNQKAYKSNFEIKKGMLETYPELIYNQQTILRKLSKAEEREYSKDAFYHVLKLVRDYLSVDISVKSQEGLERANNQIASSVNSNPSLPIVDLATKFNKPAPTTMAEALNLVKMSATHLIETRLKDKLKGQDSYEKLAGTISSQYKNEMSLLTASLAYMLSMNMDTIETLCRNKNSAQIAYPLKSSSISNDGSATVLINILKSIWAGSTFKEYRERVYKIYNSVGISDKNLMKYREYKPNIDPNEVKFNRLYPDSSSQQFGSNTLCPYGRLKDIEAISYKYPAESMIPEGSSMKRQSILEFAKEFFYNNIEGKEARTAFDNIYNMYKELEDKNINDSEEYESDYPDSKKQYIKSVDLKNKETNLMYYTKDGKPTSCFVNLSSGGNHGYKYNKDLFDYDLKKYENKQKLIEYLKDKDLSNPTEIEVPANLVDPDPYSKDDTLIKYDLSSFIKKEADGTISFDEDPKPKVFKFNGKGAHVLDKRYAYTAASKVNHNDFSSYYPTLLRMLAAFYNEFLGYDRYGEMYEQKETFGVLRKDKSLSQEERDMYTTKREGVKKVLNSASGGGDAKFYTPIRMNNAVMSMRIIGQLFTWFIGQYQTLYGAEVISTNTDGLYTIMDAKINDQTLEESSRDINIKIEPERMYLISKDSNNRLELSINENDEITGIIGAGGSALAAYNGPDVTKALAHPAIVDHVLAYYFIEIAKSDTRDFKDDFDRELARELINRSMAKLGADKMLILFQNILASSVNSQRMIFAIDDKDLKSNTTIYPSATLLQHYNRMFIMKDDVKDTKHVMLATYKVIKDTSMEKRVKLAQKEYDKLDELKDEKSKEQDVAKLKAIDEKINSVYKNIDHIFDVDSTKYTLEIEKSINTEDSTKTTVEEVLIHNPTALSMLNQAGIKKEERKERAEAAISRISGIDPEYNVIIENNNIYLMDEERKKYILDNLDIETYIDLIETSYTNSWQNNSKEAEIKKERALRDARERKANAARTLKKRRENLKNKIKEEIADKKETLKKEKKELTDRKKVLSVGLKEETITLEEYNKEIAKIEARLEEQKEILETLKFTIMYKERKHLLDDPNYLLSDDTEKTENKQPIEEKPVSDTQKKQIYKSLF